MGKENKVVSSQSVEASGNRPSLLTGLFYAGGILGGGVGLAAMDMGYIYWPAVGLFLGSIGGAAAREVYRSFNKNDNIESNLEQGHSLEQGNE